MTLNLAKVGNIKLSGQQQDGRTLGLRRGAQSSRPFWQQPVFLSDSLMQKVQVLPQVRHLKLR
jgi:hypothetical protein